MAALGIYLTNSVRTGELNNLRSGLGNEARITAEASLSSFGEPNGTGGLDVLAKKLGG